MSRVSRAGILAAHRDGVTVICELAAQFTEATWLAATPCTEWRAAGPAGPLRVGCPDVPEHPAPPPPPTALRAVGPRGPPGPPPPRRPPPQAAPGAPLPAPPPP